MALSGLAAAPAPARSGSDFLPWLYKYRTDGTLVTAGTNFPRPLPSDRQAIMLELKATPMSLARLPPMPRLRLFLWAVPPASSYGWCHYHGAQAWLGHFTSRPPPALDALTGLSELGLRASGAQVSQRDTFTPAYIFSCFTLQAPHKFPNLLWAPHWLPISRQIEYLSFKGTPKSLS